ncbi:HlyD family efflux transporter periplasmic adaptor subunit [Puteibacter caeruleilacunae]|nr:HlyD family efflux transporter periplasmic adaptor subunit [Puteibacter caeruleilacunae]
MYRKLLIITIVLFALGACNSSSEKDKFSVQHGEFQASITESGELLAVNSKSIILPRIGFQYGWRFKIIDLLENGHHVKAGETIARIDQTSVKKVIIDLKSRLEVEQATLNKIIVSHDIEFQKLETSMQEQLADFDLKKLEMEKFKFESPQKKKIKELQFEQVKINLNKAKEKIELQKVIKRNELKIQRIKVAQIKLSIENAYTALNKLEIKSPIDGIVQILDNYRTRLKYKVGDELHLGQVFAVVPDLREMKVKTSINELDFKKIKPGQQVKVRLDALPEVAFNGTVSYLGKLSKPKEQNSRVKVFDCEIVLQDSDPRLKPGMTVSSEIFYADFDDTQYVYNDCLLNENGKSYIFVKDDGEVVRKEVKPHASNNEYTAIQTDLESGQKLVPVAAATTKDS